MSDSVGVIPGVVFNPKAHIAYADGSVVSKPLIKKDIGNITQMFPMPFTPRCRLKCCWS